MDDRRQQIRRRGCRSASFFRSPTRVLRSSHIARDAPPRTSETSGTAVSAAATAFLLGTLRTIRARMLATSARAAGDHQQDAQDVELGGQLMPAVGRRAQQPGQHALLQVVAAFFMNCFSPPPTAVTRLPRKPIGSLRISADRLTRPCASTPAAAGFSSMIVLITPLDRVHGLGDQALVLLLLRGDLVVDGLDRVGVLGGQRVDELGALVVDGLGQFVELVGELGRRLLARWPQVGREFVAPPPAVRCGRRRCGAWPGSARRRWCRRRRR
jgi:hypothetical protein